MKLLTLVRHAKSSWSNFDLSDHDRSLKNVGVKRTNKVVSYLIEYGLMPELILSSTAKRALDTAKIIAGGIGYNIDNIIAKKSIYHADTDDIYHESYLVFKENYESELTTIKADYDTDEDGTIDDSEEKLSNQVVLVK